MLTPSHELEVPPMHTRRPYATSEELVFLSASTPGSSVVTCSSTIGPWHIHSGSGQAHAVAGQQPQRPSAPGPRPGPQLLTSTSKGEKSSETARHMAMMSAFSSALKLAGLPSLS
jgi:hypothetical protein